jgi:hypothetical protein
MREAQPMRNRTLLQRIVTLILITAFLAACNSSAGSVEPKPGASFNGAIDVGDKASSGTLSFNVTETGTAISNLRISLQSANCKNMITMGSVSDYQSNPGITITNGSFESPLPAMGGMVTDYKFNPGDSFPTPVPDPYTVGKFTGRFTKPTTASGTITIFLGAAMSGGIVCELGTFNWNATGS